MKKLFIEARYKEKVKWEWIKADKIPDRVGLISSVQFVHLLQEVKKYLESKGKKVFLEKGIQKHKGQVLGCEQSSATRIGALVDCFLYIGDGRFHPVGVSLKTGKDVYIFDPISARFDKVWKKDLEKVKMQRKAQLLKFYSSKVIGVIVSTKKGQNRIEKARELSKRFPDKDFFIFLFDNIDYNQLENFNFVECWINAACPRIEEDIRGLNIDDIKIKG
jgi:2-(3-amino-3-carboxypropyl)histidine synthase